MCAEIYSIAKTTGTFVDNKSESQERSSKYVSGSVYDDFDKLCFVLGIYDSYGRYTLRQVFNFAVAYADKQISKSMAFIMDYTSIKGSTKEDNAILKRINALIESANISLPRIEKPKNGKPKSRIIGVNEWLKLRDNG